MGRFFNKRHLPVLFVVLAGCAMFTSKGEYWLYRSLMESDDLSKRAELYQEYVSKYPDGAYAKEIKAIEPELEFALYNSTGMDKENIKAYL
ncbi:MAG: hypothetical protein ABIJ56_03885, partial [Pseudomonadota bacterium]